MNSIMLYNHNKLYSSLSAQQIYHSSIMIAFCDETNNSFVYFLNWQVMSIQWLYFLHTTHTKCPNSGVNTAACLCCWRGKLNFCFWIYLWLLKEEQILRFIYEGAQDSNINVKKSMQKLIMTLSGNNKNVWFILNVQFSKVKVHNAFC